jgi:tellurite methyltransferase
MVLAPGDGGYEAGYTACSCFWGTEPGSLVQQFAAEHGRLDGMVVLDAGCGEGKNAAYLQARGATVLAVDVSARAIANAVAAWGEPPGIEWRIGSVSELPLEDSAFDAVVGYGLLHCLASDSEVRRVLRKLRHALKPGGTFLLCAFNARHQDLSAHPGFRPTLLSHSAYVAEFATWKLHEVSDKDLHEQHPHNEVAHVHSMTRIYAEKPLDRPVSA